MLAPHPIRRARRRLGKSQAAGCHVDKPEASYQSRRMKTLAMSRMARWVAIAGASLAAGAACTPQTVVASSAPAANAPVRGITVSGYGKVYGKPDVARTTIGVEARAGTAEEAIADVNSRMARVIAAVKQAGVADADVRTATISLN